MFVCILDIIIIKINKKIDLQKVMLQRIKFLIYILIGQVQENCLSINQLLLKNNDMKQILCNNIKITQNSNKLCKIKLVINHVLNKNFP